MSQRDRDVGYRHLDQVLAFCFRQEIKKLNTAIPAITQTYDARTKRGEFQAALTMLVGTPDEWEANARSPILNVPVIHPSANGYLVHLPLVKGNPVMLQFTQRGIENFKATFELADPPPDNLFQERDAVAYPGFGALEIEVPEPDAITVQTEDGRQYISVNKDGNIRIICTEKVYIEAPEIELNATERTGRVVINENVDVDGGRIDLN